MKKVPVKLLIVGAGDRGFVYAGYAKQHPDEVRIVGVVEPREHYRQKMATEHGIAVEHVFANWRDAIEQPAFYDGVIIATPDTLHTEPAIAFAEKKAHILLEKPMSPDEQECERIAEAAIRNNILFGVCHVLRYTDYTQQLKQIVDSGRIGKVVSMQHLEPVGYWHQAHSFVRGNWRNEAESSFMLLAKSCHDMDWIQYMMGGKCESISSFGSLYYFKPENKPAGAADRCLDCGIESDCPYSAPRLYLTRAKEGEFDWPVNVITSDLSEAGVLEALRSGPYGRCVWACDNDVVDHQVVNMLFEGGRTVSFTMTAFTEMSDRKTFLFGTRGQIEATGCMIKVIDFLTDTTDCIEIKPPTSGHGGGDDNLMRNFVQALAENDPSKILSGPQDTLQTHRMTFAAERARRTNSVVKL